MDVKSRRTAEEIHVLARRYLAEEFADDSDAPQILDEEISDKAPWWEENGAGWPEGEWWSVPVFSRLEKTGRFDYYGRLAEVEQRILNAEKLDIEFVPVPPRTQERPDFAIQRS